MSVSASRELTSGRRLARNVLWNLSAQGLPLLAALVAIPLLLHGAGVERFGVLALAWALIGYASLFDFGLGRALTQLIAARLGQSEDGEIPVLFWTGLVLLTALGLVGSGVLLALAPWLVAVALKIPSALQDETLAAFRVIAVGIPVVTLATGLRGVLEAHQRFAVVAVVNGLLGMATFLGPLMVLQGVDHLGAMVGAILVARALAALAYGVLCLRGNPRLARPQFSVQAIRPLFSFGAWMTVTNVVGPIMDYLDRFIVAALLSIAMVAFYATPYDVVTRLWVIPSALTGVLFPAFAAALLSDRQRALNLFASGVRYVFVVLAPVVLVVVAFAHEGLLWWLGAEFALESERVVQWLAVGVLINSLARMPYALIQAAGKPDWTAKLHLLELVPYLVSVWWLVEAFGVTGAAMAWTLRAVVDTALLFLVASRLMPGIGSRLGALRWVGAATFMVLVGVALMTEPLMKMGFCAGALMLFGAVVWRWLLEPGEIGRFRAYFRMTPCSAN